MLGLRFLPAPVSLALLRAGLGETLCAHSHAAFPPFPPTRSPSPGWLRHAPRRPASLQGGRRPHGVRRVPAFPRSTGCRTAR